MTTFQFQAHVSGSGVMTLPPLPAVFHGENVTVNVDVNAPSKHPSRLDEICGGWKDDSRSTEEIIRNIYENRTNNVNAPPCRCSFEELCGVWGNEEDHEDVDRMVAAIQENSTIEWEKAKQSAQERKCAFEELCKPWREDERSTEDILRDIYESRTGSREREPL